MEEKLSEMIEQQKQKLLLTAKRIVPQATRDDILQPNDFSDLENHPEFRYEEGLLHGLQMALVSIRMKK